MAESTPGLQADLKDMLAYTLQRASTTQSHSASLQMPAEVLYENVDWTSTLPKISNTDVQTLIGNIWHKCHDTSNTATPKPDSGW